MDSGEIRQAFLQVRFRKIPPGDTYTPRVVGEHSCATLDMWKWCLQAIRFKSRGEDKGTPRNTMSTCTH